MAWYHGGEGAQRVTTAELLMLGTLFVGAGALVALVGGGPPVGPVADAGAGESPDRGRSIAVLPFVPMSGDPSDEYFGDGLTEELLNALA